VLQVEVLRQRKQQLGPDHPDTLSASQNLAISCYELGRYVEAMVRATEVLRSRKLILGPQHPLTLNTVNLLAAIEEKCKLRRRDRIAPVWKF
jgi:hypothetical protein